MTFQVGTNASDTLAVDDDLGMSPVVVFGATLSGSLTSGPGATAALASVDAAISSVSSVRSTLGATQNRLEHTINNLSVAVENLTASASRIRDTDTAMEMAQFTRHQILTQAGTAMLAQANQAPQNVLSLLGR